MTKSKKTRFNIIIWFILCFAVYILIQVRLSPFQIKEQKQFKPMFYTAKKGVKGFKLTDVSVEKDKDLVRFNLRLKKSTASQEFTQQEMKSINLFVEQFVEYLNNGKHMNYQYNTYCIRFQIKRLPVGIDCRVENSNGKYELTTVSSRHSNDIADFYIMKNVKNIWIDGGNHINLDEEKLDKFSELLNLKEIYFVADIYEEDLKPFIHKIQAVLPQCSIYVNKKKVS